MPSHESMRLKGPVFNRSRKAVLFCGLFLLSFSLFLPAQIQERFPKPDFQSGYNRPELLTPPPRAQALEYLDMAVLAAALVLATYFAHRLRSRRKLFVLMAFSLAYFGFFRKGCVCSIGAIQNVTLALFDSSYIIPVSVIIFFLLPLLFTLFFGRTFCAAVCPLGALQDVFVFKPIKVPGWLAQALGLLPLLYLGLAVLFAANGAGFIICRYDPFIGFFRFGASFNMVLFGAFMLLLGTVIARPYCRFLCPYGVILNWISRISRRHVKITPTECSNCRLCEDSCPFGAIKPQSDSGPRSSRGREVRQAALILVLLPFVVVASGWVASRLYIPLSKAHHTVALAEEIYLENSGGRMEMTDSTRAFRATGKPTELLYEEAREVQRRFKTGGWYLGGFIGLVIMLKILAYSIRRRQPEYDVDTGTCLSCARCFSYCPYEKVRLGLIGPEEVDSYVESQTSRSGEKKQGL
jgi:NosR/NirI family nitrous oxide reductase transcriptional regulator